MKTEGRLRYLFLWLLCVGVLALLLLRQVSGGGRLLKLLILPSRRQYGKPRSPFLKVRGGKRAKTEGRLRY